MKELIAEPRELYDAWVKSIIVPLTAIAEDDIKLFEQLHLAKKLNEINISAARDLSSSRSIFKSR